MNSCAICLDKSVKEDRMRMLPCWHVFCYECISRLTTDDEGNIACPSCRSKMSYSMIFNLRKPAGCKDCGNPVINPVTLPCCNKHLYCSDCEKKSEYESGIQCPDGCTDTTFNVDDLPRARICVACHVIHSSESNAPDGCCHSICKQCRSCAICRLPDIDMAVFRQRIRQFLPPTRGSGRGTIRNPIVGRRRGPIRQDQSPVSAMTRIPGRSSLGQTRSNEQQSTDVSHRHRFDEGQDRNISYPTAGTGGSRRRDQNPVGVATRVTGQTSSVQQHVWERHNFFQPLNGSIPYRLTDSQNLDHPNAGRTGVMPRYQNPVETSTRIPGLFGPAVIAPIVTDQTVTWLPVERDFIYFPVMKRLGDQAGNFTCVWSRKRIRGWCPEI